jgi:hypothetical protein
MASLAMHSPALSVGSGAGAGAGPAPLSPALTANPASSRASTAKSTRLTYHRNADGDFVCPECNIVKRNQSTMHYHMKKHLEEKDFKCKDCQKAFLNKQGLEAHLAARHPATSTARWDFECPFEDCPFSSTTKGNVRTHCMRKHFSKESSDILERDTETNTAVCTACAESFSSLPAFYYHAIRCIDVPPTDPRATALDALL